MSKQNDPRIQEALNAILADPVKSQLFNTCLFALEALDPQKVTHFFKQNRIDTDEDCAPTHHANFGIRGR